MVANTYPGYHVHVEAQVSVGNRWGVTGWYDQSASQIGVTASQLLPDDVIVVQSGGTHVMHSSYAAGNPFNVNYGSSALLSAPWCLVVTRLGKFT